MYCILETSSTFLWKKSEVTGQLQVEVRVKKSIGAKIDLKQWNIENNPFFPNKVVECEAGLVADLVEYSSALFKWTDNHYDSAFVFEALEARSHDSDDVFSRDVAGEL